jgi:hypothetical protein
MRSERFVKARASILAVGAIACAGLLAGCDEYVHITRDPDAHIAMRPGLGVALQRRARGAIRAESSPETIYPTVRR